MSFSEDDKVVTIQPHDDALVVTLKIEEYDVKRVMVDQGSGVEIHCSGCLFSLHGHYGKTMASLSGGRFFHSASKANQIGSGMGLVLVSPEKITIEKSLRLGFSATNNEAEYEVLLAGMAMVQKMNERVVEIFLD
nr:uncharacterized protein LOC112025109 [Quercus suber]